MDGWALTTVLDQVEQVYLGYDLGSNPDYNLFIRYLSKIDTSRSVAFWTLLVGAHSNTTDVVTAIVNNGRSAAVPGIDQIVGQTLVTIPFRTQFKKEQLVTELLANIRTQYLDTIPHEQLGLQEMKRISPEAAASCNFRSLLVVQSTGKGGNMKASPQSDNSPKSDIGQRLFSTEREIALSLDYGLALEYEFNGVNIKLKATFDEQVMSKTQVGRMFHQFEHILHQLCATNLTTLVRGIHVVSPRDITTILSLNNFLPQLIRKLSMNLLKSKP
jgi:hypothetical protein